MIDQSTFTYINTHTEGEKNKSEVFFSKEFRWVFSFKLVNIFNSMYSWKILSFYSNN